MAVLRHRQKGALNISKAAKNLFSSIGKAVRIGSGKALLEIAQPLVDEVANIDPEFNEYTENLSNSYAATVFINRKPVKTVFHESGSRGVPHIGVRGGRWVALTKERHGIGAEKLYKHGRLIGRSYRRKSAKRRYLHKWEKIGGYRRRTFTRQSGSSYTAGRRGWRAQNWITIENQAPYAQWVHTGVRNRSAKMRRNPAYRVLREGTARKVGHQATELVRNITMRELKKAGFKVK